MFGSNQTKKSREQFASTLGHGSLDSLYTQLQGMGDEGAALYDTAMHTIGRNDTAGNARWQASVQQLMSKQKQPPAPGAAPTPAPAPPPPPAPAAAGPPPPTPSTPEAAPAIGGLGVASGAMGAAPAAMSGLSQVAQGEGFREGFMREGWGDQGAPSLTIPGGREGAASTRALAQMVVGRGRAY